MLTNTLPVIERLCCRSISYARQVVKKYDYENYLCTLLLPPPRQNFAFALRAFNVELAQIRDRVQNVEQARFRFQFWKDVVEELFNSQMKYHTALERELKESALGIRLSKYHFHKLISAREMHFNECAFDTLESALVYAEATNTSIHYLLCEAYGLRSLAVDHTLSHLGRAQGLVYLLRGAVPLARRRRTILLPLDLLSKHHVTQESVLRLLRSDQSASCPATAADNSLCDVFHDIASVAHRHAIKAVKLGEEACTGKNARETEAAADSLTRTLLPRLLLPLIPISDYLDRLAEQGNFDPRKVDERVSGTLPFRLSWSAWRNVIPSGPRT